MSIKLDAGTRVRISGDSSTLWIQDYNVRVDSEGTVVVPPARYGKKVLVNIDYIDHECGVTAAVRRSKIQMV